MGLLFVAYTINYFYLSSETDTQSFLRHYIRFNIFIIHMHSLLRHLISRRFQLGLLCFVCVAGSYAQTTAKSFGRVDVEITKEKKPKRIHTKVEIVSAFTGGDSAWSLSLAKTLDQSLPLKNGAKPGKYIVTVVFITDKEGNLSDIRCLNDPGFGMGENVMMTIKKKTIWRPAHQPAEVRAYRGTGQ